MSIASANDKLIEIKQNLAVYKGWRYDFPCVICRLCSRMESQWILSSYKLIVQIVWRMQRCSLVWKIMFESIVRWFIMKEKILLANRKNTAYILIISTTKVRWWGHYDRHVVFFTITHLKLCIFHRTIRIPEWSYGGPCMQVLSRSTSMECLQEKYLNFHQIYNE
jgi:hypothetical protein